VAEADVDRAVTRVLRAKFLAGLFERPFVNADDVDAATNTPAHQAIALEAARKSIVLLKNTGNALPLDRGRLKTLAVIGPNAKGLHLGGNARSRARRFPAGITAAAAAFGSCTPRASALRSPADWAPTVVLGDPAKEPWPRTR
jgi:hypothetical protein